VNLAQNLAAIVASHRCRAALLNFPVPIRLLKEEPLPPPPMLEPFLELECHWKLPPPSSRSDRATSPVDRMMRPVSAPVSGQNGSLPSPRTCRCSRFRLRCPVARLSTALAADHGGPHDSPIFAEPIKKESAVTVRPEIGGRD
jgi:hypothetical protein